VFANSILCHDWGGDEFVVVQTRLENLGDAALFAQLLRNAIVEEPYELSGHHVVIDVSVGIALAPNDGTNADQLLRHADLALYGAKAEGRGGYRYFEPEMDAHMKMRRMLEVDLRQALAEGQFELCYQPLVDTRRNTVSGCEALLRWSHPPPRGDCAGRVYPDCGGDRADRSDRRMGPAQSLHGCSRLAGRGQGGGEFVSGADQEPKPDPSGREHFWRVRLVAAAARIEITESVLMRSNESNLGVLHLLREMGVRFAMDDFGRGYSSLSYLRRFPFDKIKIDRSFISDLSGRADSRKIVQAIVTLARGLGMTAPAEGVETEEQLEALRAIGCDEIQGYLFSEQRPASEITRLFRETLDIRTTAA